MIGGDIYIYIYIWRVEWPLPADGVGMNDETKTEIPNGSRLLT